MSFSKGINEGVYVHAECEYVTFFFFFFFFKYTFSKHPSKRLGQVLDIYGAFLKIN